MLTEGLIWYFFSDWMFNLFICYSLSATFEQNFSKVEEFKLCKLAFQVLIHHTSRTKTYNKSGFFFGAQYSTYATKQKLQRKKIAIISLSKVCSVNLALLL